MASTVPTTTDRRAPSGTVSLALGIVALLGIPAGPLMRLASPEPSTSLLVAMAALQLVLALGAVGAGLVSKPRVAGRRPPSARAGIALGGLTLAVNFIMAVALTFNSVGNSMDRSVVETEPMILHQN